MKLTDGTIIPEVIQNGTDNFDVVTTAGSDITLTKATRALYFPVAVTSLVVANGAGTSKTIGAITAGLYLPIATTKILAATTSGKTIVVLY